MAVLSPRVAASSAHPAPVAPPPITKTSNWSKNEKVTKLGKHDDAIVYGSFNPKEKSSN